MAIEAIEKHNWPGNVRELRNVIDRAIMLETTDKIGLSSIFIESEIQHSAFDVHGPGLQTELPQHRVVVREQPSDPMSRQRHPQTGGFFVSTRRNESLSHELLQESGWQKTRAAALLGITRATLYAKVKQHNIQRGTYMPKPEERLTVDDQSFMACPEQGRRAEPEPVAAY